MSKEKPRYLTQEEIDEIEESYRDKTGGHEDAIKAGYCEPIGRFLVEFSRLEGHLGLFISIVSNADTYQQAYHIIELLNVNNKISYIERSFLFKITRNYPELLEDFKKIISDFRLINSFRNKVAHANWISLKKNGDVTTKININQDDGDIVEKTTNITLKDFDDYLHKIEVSISAIHDIHKKIDFKNDTNQA